MAPAPFPFSPVARVNEERRHGRRPFAFPPAQAPPHDRRSAPRHNSRAPLSDQDPRTVRPGPCPAAPERPESPGSADQMRARRNPKRNSSPRQNRSRRLFRAPARRHPLQPVASSTYRHKGSTPTARKTPRPAHFRQPSRAADAETLAPSLPARRRRPPSRRTNTNFPLAKASKSSRNPASSDALSHKPRQTASFRTRSRSPTRRHRPK